ncbi:hypothetical protein UHQ56_10400 [Lacticaseibacillus rhamnosus]|nr:hypothetical protein UHQ56_10400 [Lacticaseibacillus rhamnosus]
MSKTKNFVETLRELREACSQLNEAIADLNVTLKKSMLKKMDQKLKCQSVTSKPIKN